MSAYLVFNHHSLPFRFPAQAQAAVPDFLRICEKAIRLGKDTILIDQTQDRHWFQIELAPNYSWQDWHNQARSQADLTEQIRAFRSIATRQPFFSEAEIRSGADGFEVWQTDQTPAPVAIMAACWHQAPLISFASSPAWQISPIRVQIRMLDDMGHLQDSAGEVVNIHSLAALEAVSASWQAQRDATLRRGRDLWQTRLQRYPHLVFCGKTETQLCSWRQSDTVFEQVKQVLAILDQFAMQWRANVVPAYSHEALREAGLPHRVTGESESCNKDSKRRSERTFYLPTGEKAYFENHVKLANGQRLHFYPDDTLQCIYIGYIGAHLT